MLLPAQVYSLIWTYCRSCRSRKRVSHRVDSHGAKVNHLILSKFALTTGPTLRAMPSQFNLLLQLNSSSLFCVLHLAPFPSSAFTHTLPQFAHYHADGFLAPFCMTYPRPLPMGWHPRVSACLACIRDSILLYAVSNIYLLIVCWQSLPLFCRLPHSILLTPGM